MTGLIHGRDDQQETGGPWSTTQVVESEEVSLRVVKRVFIKSTGSFTIIVIVPCP